MDGLGGTSAPIIFITAAAAVVAALFLLPSPFGAIVVAAIIIAYLWMNRHIEASVRRLPAQLGAESLMGRRMQVVEPLKPAGVVSGGGELWGAVAVKERYIERGQDVIVVGARGLRLVVEAADQESQEG